MMNTAIRYTNIFTMCLLIAIIVAFRFTPLHKHRIEDRGQGYTAIRVTGDKIIVGGMYSRNVRILSEGKEIGHWNLEGPIQSVYSDPERGRIVALQYQDDGYYILGPDSKDIRHVRVPMQSEIIVSAMIRGRDAWYLAFYEKGHDYFVKKEFPFIFPALLRFRYGVLRLPNLTPKKSDLQIVYEARAIWHEESSHPWILRFNSSRNVLYMLNPMAEEVTAIDLDADEELFRIDTPPGPVDMEIDDNRVFIALPEADHIQVLDSSTGGALVPINVGLGVVSLAKQPDGVAALSKYQRRIILAEFREGRWVTWVHAMSGLPTAINALDSALYVTDGSTANLSVLTRDSLMSDDALEVL